MIQGKGRLLEGVFHSEGRTDIAALKAHTARKSKGDGSPKPVILHMHKHDEACSGAEHEEYFNGKPRSV